MKKSIFLFFAAILCAIGMNAATVTSDGTARLYFNLKAVSWWNAGTNGNGNFGYFFNNSTGKNAWSAHAVQYSGDTYYLVIPKGTWAGVILTRNNTSTAPDWNNKWNQTGDITLSSTSNYISKFSEGSNSVTWGTAVKPASTAKVSSAASTIYVGASTTLTPSLTSNADINDIKSTTYTITPATGASISGNTFTASAEGTYTIKATVTYHPDGYSSLTSTATAETTIKAEVPAEETHDVTVSYMCGETKLQDPTTVNTVGVEKSVKVTAPEIAKYTFVNWTLGADVVTTDDLTSNEINITTKAGGSDFTLVANYEKAKLTYTVTVPAGTENCYLVGAMNGWDEKNPYEMTKQGENVFTTTLEGVATTDEYKYLSQKGTWDYEEVGGNRTWTANDVVTAWKDPLATNVHLVGNMFANWDKTPDKEFRKATKDATTASISVTLDANKDYELKVRRGDDWTSCTSKITNTVSNLQFSTSNGDNCKMKTTVAGEYTFTWTISSSKLAVTYPTIYAITANANGAAMGTIAGAGEYGKGSTATLTATPNDGYLFVNWTKGGEEVSTDATYSFKVEEAVELVANFEAAPEEVHNVTVSYICSGNKIAEDQTVAAVGETTPKTAEAPEIFGYTFASWTLGEDVTTDGELTSKAIDINIKAGGSDFTLTASYTEIPKVTIYFVNNKKWSKVYAYGWGGSVGENPGWPGAEITANTESEKIAGFDVYSYSVVPGSYVNIKFTNGSGTESANFKWTDGKYYYMDADANYVGGTKEEVTTILAPDPLATNVYLAGEMTNWGTDKIEFKKATADATTATVTVNLTAKSYTYQLVIDGNWYGNTGTMKRGGDAVHEGGWSFEDTSYGANCTIVADFAGDYTFTWNLETKKLTVTYPELPTYTVTATAENGTVTGAGEYKHGIEATLVAIPNAGYAFVNWKKGEEVVSSEASYTFTVTANTDLVAVFAPEETHEVTVSYLCNSNPIPGRDETTLAVGVTTPSTITAPAITNYKFDSWTLGSGVQAVDATANPIQITTLAEGEYNLVANYTKIELTYTVTVPEGTEKCYIAGDMNSWSFQEMTPTANANEFTITIDGATTAHKYKYTCGEGWAFVEKKEDGSELDADRTYNANDVVAKWAELAKCYLMGNGDWDNGVEMEYDSENGQYILLAHYISAPFKFKMGDEWSDKVENNTANGVTWTDEDEDGNYDINLPVGYYDFFFKKDSKKVYIAAAEPYTRDVRQGYYGTICLSTAGQMVGASIFEIAYKDKDASKIYFDEIVSGKMEAGIPYIFLPNEGVTTLKVFYTEMAVVAAGRRNGLVGSYTQELLAVDGNNYILLNNQYCEVIGEAYVGENRAYFQLGSIPDSAPAPAHGVRRVSMGMAGQNTATGMENIDASAQPVKTIINGQLFILRGEKMYDAQGKLVK